MKGDWWRTHFSAETMSGYGLDSKSSREVDGLLRLAHLKKGAAVLDLCCGEGRHAIPLAKRGFRVTGLDYQREFLKTAHSAARAAGVRVEFVRADARRPRFERRFDAIFNLFTSFGYFATEAEDLALLRSARRALKPGGALYLDLLNKEWLMRHFEPSFVQKGDGTVKRAVNRVSSDLARGRLDNRRTLFLKNGRRKETALSFRVYALVELRRLLETAGLRFEKAWGGFDGRPYGLDTFRMIVRARRIR